MQLSSQERQAFYKRTMMSVGIFAFFLSLAANVFFLVTRTMTTPTDALSSVAQRDDETLMMGAQAYGKVQRGFAPRTQKASGTSALLPVRAYVVPENFVPPLTGALPLYRDQGVPLDELEVQRIFDRLGVAISWQNLQLLPTLQQWRTADRTMDLTLDIEKRALTLKRTGVFSPAPEGRAGDDTVIAIARDFASSLGIDVASYGAPSIIERSAEPDAGVRTYVMWPMTFRDVPLLDLDAQPVPAVQVQVGRLSRKALSMTLTLLQPDRMTISAYPKASKDVVSASLKDGGLLPIAKEVKGTKTDVVYSSLAPAFVLLVGDRQNPTYIVPVLLAEFRQGRISGRTFVPSISPEHFFWRPAPPQSSSASGVIKTVTGSR